MKIFTPEEWKAKEAERTTPAAKRYSKLKIIRLLGDQWETYRARMEAAGIADQFWAAEYLDESDPVFAAFLENVPPEVRELLDQCLWEE